MKDSHNHLWILLSIALFSGACAENAPITEGPVRTIGIHVQVINNSDRVVASQLTIVSVDEAQSTYLRDDTRIAGYPIAETLINLSITDSSFIKSLILNDTSYATPLIRCANRSFYGIRFISGKEKIEFAFGKPCNQVIWAYHENGSPQQWGGIINNAVADKIISIINNAR